MAKDPYRPLDYVVLPVAALRAATGGLPAETLGTLLQLFLRAATELSGGRIEHAATTTTAPRCNIPGIWHWEGDALILDIYPADYEAKVLAKRFSYSSNAHTRYQKEKSNRTFNNPAEASHAIASPTAYNCTQYGMQLHEGTMQLHNSGCNSMQSTMPLHPCAPARDSSGNYISGEEGINPTPPISDKNFRVWWRTIAATHPTGQRLQELPYDVLRAAWSAYQSIPSATDLAPLLQAYMASKLQTNKYGQRYWRATGIERYFSNLLDHISHAERWAAETGYHRKNKPKDTPPPKKDKDPDDNETMTREQLDAYFASLREPTPQQETETHKN